MGSCPGQTPVTATPPQLHQQQRPPASSPLCSPASELLGCSFFQQVSGRMVPSTGRLPQIHVACLSRLGILPFQRTTNVYFPHSFPDHFPRSCTEFGVANSNLATRDDCG